jgi:dTDP-4-dehydrorhamnose reductase
MNTDNILILGDGYMGNHIFKHLNSKGFANVIKKSSKDLHYHDEKDLYLFILNNSINTVINCSGFTGKPNIDEAEIKKELCWELNAMSPLRVNRVCETLGAHYIHISSGCIFDGYEKEWDEDDPSNYGLFTTHSSFYSKSKHAFELLSKDLRGVVLRIRMPFGPDSSSRNYLSKIRRYDNLIQYKNSKTYIPDLCNVVENILDKDYLFSNKRQIFNVVNPNPLPTNEVCDIMKKYGFHNNNWKFVPLAQLEIATSRSNCVLNGNKVGEIYKMKTEEDALHECLEIRFKNQIDYLEKMDLIEEKYNPK